MSIALPAGIAYLLSRRASYFDLKKWKPIPLCGSGFARRAVRVERVNGEIMLVSVIERARE